MRAEACHRNASCPLKNILIVYVPEDKTGYGDGKQLAQHGKVVVPRPA